MADKFYTFMQNNSGGVFHINDQVSHVVIIEAKDAFEANEIAQDVAGIYFHGVSEGCDCDCCGDRWSSVDEWDAHDVPSVYSTPLNEYSDMWAKYAIVYKRNENNGKHTAEKHVY